MRLTTLAAPRYLEDDQPDGRHHHRNVNEPLLHTPRLAAALVACLLPIAGAMAAPASTATLPRDVLYGALHGEPENVDPTALVGVPGRYVGRAVRTSGRLVTVDAGASRFDLAIGKSRVVLRLEPEARALVAARSATWEGVPVTVEGFFYREAGSDPTTGPYALRAWLVWPVSEPAAPPPAAEDDARRVSLQDLVYGAGRYDGQVVKVRGSYRGSNRHADLPERTRKGRGDWVIKDGYFAAWVTGRDAKAGSWDAAKQSASDAAPVLDIVGVPSTSGGVVRLQARDVDL